MGPIYHVDKRLANRSRSYAVILDRARFRRRLDPVQAERLKSSAHRLYRDLGALVMEADLTEEQRRQCRRALRRFWVRDVAARGRARLSAMRHGLCTW
jgi:hypothetical protein